MTDFPTPYRSYDVLDKWDTPSWDQQTREVVSKRLDDVPGRQFFNEDEWALLEAISARLIPQPDRAEPVPIVPFVDQKLAQNRGDGYRYEGMPPMREAWRKGLAAIGAESRKRHGASFAELAEVDQDELLAAVQTGRVDGQLWHGLPPAQFFRVMLLKQVVAAYYAHPAAWSEIGFGGPASPRGYARLGFDQRDPWEAKAEDD